ncbi:hypothetical protein ACH9L7_14865 [Haloferax sp. S1W]|uniref:hypothetical protein n=1 Tax=Haloferax sp. S1W TaxID=3377110 RepID=UPI0037C57F0B
MNAKLSTDFEYVESIENKAAEDPRREPHEKETAAHATGDADYFSITSFKKVIFARLLTHPDFEIEHINILDSDHNERTVQSLEEATQDSVTAIIGVTGKLPIGTWLIGVARNSNSHADIVK